MLTKYYSEVLKKSFDTEQECLDAEAKYNEEHAAELARKEKRAADAKNVEELYKEANAKLKEANEALSEFVKEYGSYHATYTGSNLPVKTLTDYLFDSFWF